jgi:hypothetical protein
MGGCERGAAAGVGACAVRGTARCSGDPRHTALLWATVTRTAPAWRRRGEHGGALAAAALKWKGQGSASPLRSRRACAGVHACVLRGVHRRAREGMFAPRTRRGARHGAAATDGTGTERKWKKGTRRAARALTTAAAPARFVPAWHEGRLHQRWRGGAGMVRSTSARWPGHPRGTGSECPHLGGHGPECRRVGEGRRCSDEEGGGAGRGRRAVRRRGSRAGRGRGRSWLPRVRLLLAGSSGVAAVAQVRLRGGGAAPGSPSSSSSPSPLAAGRRAGDWFSPGG